ncbi:MAG: carbon-nitrogen hydrolase family protein [Acidobacteriia bacterium]|nr:carbon-nitrogen hydrolase family protein [Terriglobia bacterium]
MSTFVVAGVQMNPILMDKEGNLSLIIQQLQLAASEQARLVVFPECALTGYCFESLEEAIPYAETIPGSSTNRLIEACQKLNIHLVLGMLEKDDEQCYNAAVLLGPQGLIGKYRKIHLPFLGVDRFVNPGNLGFQVHETPLGRIGLNICYDGRFPESARALALRGADIVLLPTNWPKGAEEFAEFLVNARGIENHLFSIAVNRVGKERGFQFIGRSRVANPEGKTLATASGNQEEIIYAEIDPLESRNKQIVRIPGKLEINCIKDRRPQYYDNLTGS